MSGALAGDCVGAIPGGGSRAVAVARTGLVSVIVPSTCDPGRAHAIRRSLASVARQQGVAWELIFVPNGPRCSEALLSALAAEQPMRIVRMVEGNVSRARYRGLGAAQGEFFMFLDDDDELLPDALNRRVGYLAQDDSTDVLVTNGYFFQGMDELAVDSNLAEVIQANPAEAMLRQNWFTNGSSLFRRATVELALFDTDRRFFEITYLFFRLMAAGKRIRFVNEPTFRIHVATADSASKSDAYCFALPQTLLDVMALPVPTSLRAGLRRKYLSALNTAMTLHLERGQIGEAFRDYVKCLSGGGLRYAPSIRRIAAKGIRRAMGASP